MNQNRLDEITEKLNRLKAGGGVTRPLVPANNGGSEAAGYQQYQQLLRLVGEIKDEFNLFRRETSVALKEIRLKIEDLSGKGASVVDYSKKDFTGGAEDDSYGDILEELSALKQHIKSALDFDKD